jgi:hypothetical protein
MRLTPPSQSVFLISVVVTFIGVLIFVGAFSMGISAFWLMAAAYVVLLIGNLARGV